MRYRPSLTALVVLAVPLLPAVESAMAAERVLMRNGPLVASVGEGWCDREGLVFVDAPDPSAFTGDGIDLQRLVGGLRVVLPLECPQLQSLRIIGRVGGVPVRTFGAGAETGWRLVEMAGATLPRAAAPPVDAPPTPGPTAPVRDLTDDPRAVAEAQRLLTALGYDPGPVDGLMGRRTRVAITDFQRDHGLPVDPRVTDALLAALREAAYGPSVAQTRVPSAAGAPVAPTATPGPGGASSPTAPSVTTAPVPETAGIATAAGATAAPTVGPPGGTRTAAAMPAEGARFVVPPPRPRLPDEADACDLLAADPWDPERVAEGVELDEIDGTLALEACTRALEQLSLPRFAYQRARALVRLGRIQEAVKALQVLADQGHLPAKYLLAVLLLRRGQDGDGQERGADLLKAAAAAGYPPAQALLASYRYEGSRIGSVSWRQDFMEAARLAQGAAAAGYPDAAFFLGRMYQAGAGVPVSAREALRWYRLAAEKGHREALQGYALFDPAGAEDLRSKLLTEAEERKKRLALARERAIAMLEEERAKMVLTPLWPDDVLAALDELRWALFDKIRSDVERVAETWSDLGASADEARVETFVRFWRSLAGSAPTSEAGETTSGLRLVRELVELYRDADEAERRRVYELYLWGLGELESPVRLPDWAAEAEPARGAAAMAGILDARLVRLAETLRSVRAADPQLPETLRDVIVRFREAIVRSAEERVVGPPAGPEEAGGPVLGAVAAFGAAREMAAAMRGGTIRIVTTVEEMRGDGVRVARVLQGFFAGEGGSVAQVIVVVPLAPGAPLPEASGVELPAEAFRPATAQAFPAVLALELASLRWTLERFAARVERMAGISGTAAWEPRPERRAVAALGPTDGAGSGTTIVFPEKSQEGTGSGPQPTQATTAEAASPSSEQAGERTPGTLTSGEAYGGAEPSAPAPPEGAAGTTARTAASAGGEAATGPSQRIEVTLADGSTVRADYVRADLRYRSLFGEVPVPLDRIRQYRDGVLTLGDGTAVKGEFGSGTLTVRTLFGEVTIDGAQIRALQWVEE